MDTSFRHCSTGRAICLYSSSDCQQDPKRVDSEPCTERYERTSAKRGGDDAQCCAALPQTSRSHTPARAALDHATELKRRLPELAQMPW
jgi:hypothetical protein